MRFTLINYSLPIIYKSTEYKYIKTFFIHMSSFF